MNLKKKILYSLFLNYYEYKLNNKKNNKKKVDKQCRICMEKIDSKVNPFLNPCECKGTVKWIHKECLLKWINTSKNYSCPQCKYYYKLKTKYKYPLLKYLIKYIKYIIIIITFISSFSLTIFIKYISYKFFNLENFSIFDHKLVTINIRVINIFFIFNYLIFYYYGLIDFNDPDLLYGLSNHCNFYLYNLNIIRKLLIDKINKVNKESIFIENFNNII